MRLSHQDFSSNDQIAVYCSSFSTLQRVVRVISSETASTKCSNEKEFKKYYGKKVAKLIYGHRQSSTNFPAYRCKALRSCTMHTSPNKHPPRSIKHLKISYYNSNKKDRNLSDFLMRVRQWKHLTSLKIRVHGDISQLLMKLSLRQIRTLNYLRILSLKITESQLIEGLKSNFKIKSLKSLHLDVQEPTEARQQEEALEIYSMLIRSKTLKHLVLTLQKLKYNSAMTSSLLQELSQTSLPSFEIGLTILHNDLISNKILDAALLEVDLFAFKCTRKVTDFICNTTRISHLPSDEPKRRLVLELVPNQNWEFPEINAVEPLKDLKQLFAHFLGSLAPTMLELHNVTSLKSLSLDCSLPMKKSLLDTQKSLCSVLKKAKVLEHLKLSKIFMHDQFDVDIFEPVFIEISNLNNLKALEIVNVYCSTSGQIDMISRPLKSLVNLTSLKMKITLRNSNGDLHIPFPENSKLTELALELPKLNSESQIKLIQVISNLTELQKFTFTDGTECFEKEDTRLMLFETLLSMTKLIEIEIADDLNGRFFELYDNYDQDESEIAENMKVAGKLRDFGKKLFQKNLILKRLSFVKSGAYEIKYGRY